MTDRAGAGFAGPLVSLGADQRNRRVVSVLVKRTYDVVQGECRPADEQLPLHPPDPDPYAGFDPSWSGEIDVAPYKVATDLVAFGEAHAPHSRCTTMAIQLQIGPASKTIRVFGDRRCDFPKGRPPVFSSPEPFERLPLTYERAYGGSDPNVKFPSDPDDFVAFLAQLVQSPGAYPRNPVGRGYVVHADQAVDGIALPNFEDPRDLLTPSRMVTGAPADWHRQPLPQGLGWVDVGWFPRCVFGGGLAVFPPPAFVREVELGYLPADFLDRLNTQSLEALIDIRLMNGAQPGLIVPYLTGDEGVRISGMNAAGDLVFFLPGDRPRITIRFKGTVLETETVPHTVCVFPAERTVAVLWRTSAPLPDAYLEPLPTRENMTPNPADDFEVSIDWHA